ncbi:MAG: hypothetical protein V7607_5697 [Solirubrobacteraceae bacterium]
MRLIEGKVALVTGGASGNGRAIAVALARQGASAVVIADVRKDPREGGAPTHELIARETEASTEFVQGDLSSDEGIAAAVAAAERFGGAEILVNNAGLYWAEDFLEVTREQYRRMMDVNVLAPFFLSQAVAQGMIARGGGSVVNVTSGAAVVGSAGRSTYCTSKGALQTMTYALAAELGPRGVRVNAVMPGMIRTAMTTVDVPSATPEALAATLKFIPMRRVGEPEDVADAVVYLCSALAGYVNGAGIEVDGGALHCINLNAD